MKRTSYQDVQVMTADGVRLIILLYEGVIRFNNRAAEAMERGDVEKRTVFINKSIAIIAELSGSLNMEEGGEIARNLSRLYDFSIERLTRANGTNDTAHIESVNRVIKELKAGWEALAAHGARPEEAREPISLSHGA